MGRWCFFVISGDEAKSADYSNSATELAVADDAEEFLAELEYVLDVLEGAGMESDKQFDLTPILFTYNICWLMSKSKQFSELLENDSYLAERFASLASALFSKAEELRQLESFIGLDGDSKIGEKADYPSWYYHFVGDYYGKNESYIDVKYKSFSDDPWTGDGKIWFFAPGNSNPVEFPVKWRVQSDQTQRFYFSCYFDTKFKWTPIPIPMPIIFNLLLLGVYWRWDGEWDEAKATFNIYNFCESCVCKPEEIDCIANCRAALRLDDKNLLDDPLGISFGDDWARSPLLILTPFRSKWEYHKSPEYFDSIYLLNDSDKEIKLSDVDVRLNSVDILFASTVSETLAPHSSLELTDYIWEDRRGEVTSHDPTRMTPILEAAAQNIGQTWDPSYLCEEEWKKEYGAWCPIPNDWCGDFVRTMIIDHSDLELKPRCDICGGEYLWSYFERLNKYYTGSELWGEYRISPRDINPDTFMIYKWQDLATAVQSGYAASLAKKTAKGEKTYHQTIFISWRRGEAPAPNKCRATYWAIGGCQSDSINVKYFSICNGESSNCVCEPGEEIDPEYYDCCLTTDRWWGADHCTVSQNPDDPDCPNVFCNLFGRTME